MKFLLASNKKLYLYGNHETIFQMPFKLVDSFINNASTLVVSSHKTLTLYQLQEKHGSDFIVSDYGFNNMPSASFAKRI